MKETEMHNWQIQRDKRGQDPEDYKRRDTWLIAKLELFLFREIPKFFPGPSALVLEMRSSGDHSCSPPSLYDSHIIRSIHLRKEALADMSHSLCIT